MIIATNHPTHLWIADHQTLELKIIEYLQKKLCSRHACQSCMTCQQIQNKEHPWVIWATPERSYALEQIDEIIAMSSFQLDKHEERFIIFQQAERLTEQCSNRLLKTIEEPNQGYHFFFLTTRIQALPLTIQSRCIVQKFNHQNHIEAYQNFLQPFINEQLNEPINFIKQIDTLDIKEQETKDLVDWLFEYWSEKLKAATINHETEKNKLYFKILTILEQAIENPPMPGSAKIFWKNIYIKFYDATQNYRT